MGQPADGEACGVGFLFQYEQQRFASAIGPFHQHRHIQLAKAVAEALLELFLADRNDPRRLIQTNCFPGGKEFQRLLWVVQDQILEVLIVAIGHCVSLRVVVSVQHCRDCRRRTGAMCGNVPGFAQFGWLSVRVGGGSVDTGLRRYDEGWVWM